MVRVVAPGLAMIPLGRLRIWSGLTSGTTSGMSGSPRSAELLSMTTTPRAAAIGRPVGGHRRRDVDQGDVDAVEELGRQLLHDDLAAADGEHGAGVLGRGGSADLAPDVGPHREHLPGHRPHGSRGTDQGEGRARGLRGE